MNKLEINHLIHGNSSFQQSQIPNASQYTKSVPSPFSNMLSEIVHRQKNLLQFILMYLKNEMLSMQISRCSFMFTFVNLNFKAPT